jgi:hypothetical protein
VTIPRKTCMTGVAVNARSVQDLCNFGVFEFDRTRRTVKRTAARGSRRPYWDELHHTQYRSGQDSNTDYMLHGFTTRQAAVVSVRYGVPPESRSLKLRRRVG